MGDHNADPYLDAGVKGWIHNAARANYWKVASWYEFEDLVQEGYLCYAKCRAGFRPPSGGTGEPTKEDRKTFMGFLEAAFRNRVIDLQKDPRSLRQELTEADMGDENPLESWAASAQDLGDANLAVLLAQAPAEIGGMLKQILVDGLADAPYLQTRLRRQSNGRVVKGRRRVRETTEQHYDRCLGRTGVVRKLREYFGVTPKNISNTGSAPHV